MQTPITLQPSYYPTRKVRVMAFNFQELLSTINQATSVVGLATLAINGLKEASVVLSQNEEDELEAAITALEEQLPGLRTRAQNKLRGT